MLVTNTPHTSYSCRTSTSDRKVVPAFAAGVSKWNDESRSALLQARRKLEEAVCLDEVYRHLGWQTLEASRCELSAEASLINLLRSSIPAGVPMAVAMKHPLLVAGVGVAYRKELRQICQYW